MSSRPTIADLAKAAGVSVATVDRVLNGRHKVREETSRRVYDAATGIGFHGVSQLPRPQPAEGMPQYRVGFILPKPKNHFFQALATELERAVVSAPGILGVAQIEFVADDNPAQMVETLRAVGARNQAVAIAAPDYPALAIAIAELKAKGVPVFSVLSDLAPGIRQGYIGVNNRKAGRTAAWMIAKVAKRPGKVAVFVGSHRIQGHEMREMGFRSYFRENAVEFEVLNTLIDIEGRETTYDATAALLRQHPDLVGLYITGGGMEGAIAAIGDAKRLGDLNVVATELTPESRTALADGVILMAISTPIHNLSRELVTLMIGAIENGPASVPGQTFLPFEMYVQENL
jgi:LacI family transcriptional regulator